MKTLGLVGGISWISTIEYYRLINQGINERLGGLNFSQCVIYSFNYEDIKRNNDRNDWEATFQLVSRASHHLKDCGAEALVLCANTIHKIAGRLEKDIDIPLLHIAVPTAVAVKSSGVTKVGLLGTKFTMEQDFFTEKLTSRGITTIIPGDEDRDFIHGTISGELGKGIILESTRKRYLTIIEELIGKGAEGIILGCTEIPLVVDAATVTVPVFDTVVLHARAAIEFALG